MFSDKHSGEVKSFMLDILCPLISESDSVSNELSGIILSNIVEPLKSQRKNAYELARELLLKCNETLKPYKALHYSLTPMHIEFVMPNPNDLTSVEEFGLLPPSDDDTSQMEEGSEEPYVYVLLDDGTSDEDDPENGIDKENDHQPPSKQPTNSASKNKRFPCDKCPVSSNLIT